jgi:bacterial leucyl aminopeptidase
LPEKIVIIDLYNIMRSYLLIIAGAFFVLSMSGFTVSFGKQVVVNADDLKGWINYLASDEMRGRANGSPEMRTAANWLSERFKEYGLKPVLQNSEYLQNYSFSSRQRTVNERNVIGILEGTDPLLKDQYIVLSAHFDHVGVRRGNDNDSIYNGADDNAAGTCTLLGIAKTIKNSGLKPGRTIIFTAFSGEESGLRGSRYFVANARVSIKNVYADLNFEMTGHSEYLGKKRYYMTGCSVSNLSKIIGEYNKNSEWKLIDTIPIANNLFFASDNIAFSRISSAENISQGIPSGTFATTTLADYIHSPRDEGKLFDYENMAGLVKYFTDLVIWLSENKTEIGFTDPSFARLK